MKKRGRPTKDDKKTLVALRLRQSLQDKIKQVEERPLGAVIESTLIDKYER